jgi:hypothetical protein
MPRQVQVRIKPGPGGLEFDPPHFHVSKNYKDEVLWTCESSDFTVDFGNRSPFERSFFKSVQGAVSSGKAVVDPGGPYYDYTVTLTAGAGADPDGEVDP